MLGAGVEEEQQLAMLYGAAARTHHVLYAVRLQLAKAVQVRHLCGRCVDTVLCVVCVAIAICVCAAGLPWWAPRDVDRVLHGSAPGVPLPAGAVSHGAAGLRGECHPAGGTTQLQVGVCSNGGSVKAGVLVYGSQL
jgi:hypothetical protein